MGHARPRTTIECPPRGADGQIHIRGLCRRDPEVDLFGCRVDDIETGIGTGFDPLAVDEQSVGIG
jgi:hypothetical protein